MSFAEFWKWVNKGGAVRAVVCALAIVSMFLVYLAAFYRLLDEGNWPHFAAIGASFVANYLYEVHYAYRRDGSVKAAMSLWSIFTSFVAACMIVLSALIAGWHFRLILDYMAKIFN